MSDFFLHNPTANGQTTDATPLDLATIPMEAGESLVIEVSISGRRTATDDAASYLIGAGAMRGAAGGAAVNGVTLVVARETLGATTWDAAIVASGNDIIIRVTGQAAATIDWRVEWRPLNRS